MRELALQLPGMSTRIPCTEGFRFCASAETSSIGYILSQFYVLALYLAAALLFIWFVWGAFEYLFAGGNKEGLGKARKRMIYAIVGFVFIVLAWTISQYAQTLFPQVNQFYSNNKAIPRVPGTKEAPGRFGKD